jgi:hypothetical protein
MAKQKGWVKGSGYLFLLGIIVALIAGIVPNAIPSTSTILVVLGVIVGLLAALGWGSISREYSETFLIAVIALIAAGGAGNSLVGIPTIGGYLKAIVDNLAILVAPAAVIIAIEAIWKSAAVKLG